MFRRANSCARVSWWEGEKMEEGGVVWEGVWGLWSVKDRSVEGTGEPELAKVSDKPN